jgi:translation elongation factor EF-Ts
MKDIRFKKEVDMEKQDFADSVNNVETATIKEICSYQKDEHNTEKEFAILKRERKAAVSKFEEIISKRVPLGQLSKTEMLIRLKGSSGNPKTMEKLIKGEIPKTVEEPTILTQEQTVDDEKNEGTSNLETIKTLWKTDEKLIDMIISEKEIELKPRCPQDVMRFGRRR